MTKKWYKWPSGYYKRPWFPWYTITWRLLTAPLLLVSWAFFYLSLIINQGTKEAKKFAKDWSI